jgi:hypothetical protein
MRQDRCIDRVRRVLPRPRFRTSSRNPLQRSLARVNVGQPFAREIAFGSPAATGARSSGIAVQSYWVEWSGCHSAPPIGSTRGTIQRLFSTHMGRRCAVRDDGTAGNLFARQGNLRLLQYPELIPDNKGACNKPCQIAEMAGAVAFGPHLGAHSSLGLLLPFRR